MELKTKDFYSRKLITIPEWETPENGLKIMKNNFIRHLPVIDEKTGKILGIVSDRDLLAEMSNRNIFVRDLMCTKVLSFDLNTPLKKMVDEMIAKKVSSFLIKKEGEYCGIITTEDMLHVLSLVLDEQKDPMVYDLLPFLNFKYKYQDTLLA